MQRRQGRFCQRPAGTSETCSEVTQARLGETGEEPVNTPHGDSYTKTFHAAPHACTKPHCGDLQMSVRSAVPCGPSSWEAL